MLIDPRSLPLDPDFDEPSGRGPHLAAERLTPEALRRRFLRDDPWQPELRGDARVASGAPYPPRPAAVLVPLLQYPDRLNVLLTHRAWHLQAHAGQIAFPGGSIEPGDAGPIAAALREACEEIGLPEERTEVLGTLPKYLTASHFEVTPVIGLIRAPIELQLDAAEVEDVFEVPLSFLMDPRHHQRHLAEHQGSRRTVYTIVYKDASRERLIWGTTAAILRNLYGFLSV